MRFRNRLTSRGAHPRLRLGLRARPHVAAPIRAACPSRPSSLPPSSQLQHDIDGILAQPALEHGYWGVLVKSLETDDTLFALNAGKLMMPASNMKIVTLAAAAERLGWDYTYETRVVGRRSDRRAARSTAIWSSSDRAIRALMDGGDGGARPFERVDRRG